MRKILFYLLFSCLSILFTSCSGGVSSTSSGESSSCDEISLDCVEDAITESASTTEDILISSSASDNATVAFGQTYQHQVSTSGSYSGSVIYSLSNAPDGMTISSSGLVEWTPTNAADITTHSNITIRITTASGYVITQTYDLTVTGTCTSGNVLAIWTGDQRTSTDSDKFLGNITAYTDNASDNCGRYNNLDCTPTNNYEYNQTNSVSENLHIGPETSPDDGIMFFYNQYDNTSYTYLFWMFGEGGSAFSPSPNYVYLDLFTAKNESSDNVVVDDDASSNETIRQSQSESSGIYSSTYTGRYGYASARSDGGVIGPFSGTNYRIFVDRAGTSTINSATLTLGNLDSFVFWSKDNSSFSLGSVDNFTVGFKTSVECN